jgi:hypothetical protein
MRKRTRRDRSQPRDRNGSVKKDKSKELLEEAQHDIMLHLGLLRLGVNRLLKVLTRRAPVVDVKRAKRKGRSPTYPPLQVADLQFLDDEFKRLAGDATGARVRLHQCITLLRLDEEKKDRG